jgi:hypothetical protein
MGVIRRSGHGWYVVEYGGIEELRSMAKQSTRKVGKLCESDCSLSIATGTFENRETRSRCLLCSMSRNGIAESEAEVQADPLGHHTRSKIHSSTSTRCEKLLLHVKGHNNDTMSRRDSLDIESGVWATQVTTSRRPNCARRRDFLVKRGGEKKEKEKKRKEKKRKRTSHIKSLEPTLFDTYFTRNVIIQFPIIF